MLKTRSRTARLHSILRFEQITELEQTKATIVYNYKKSIGQNIITIQKGPIKAILM